MAAVVLNRVNSDDFPNTISEVIYEPRAFTCVDDGQIELMPDIESYRAAVNAIMGYDPTSGCLFYYNPRIATSRWMKERIPVDQVSVGNHIFMK